MRVVQGRLELPAGDRVADWLVLVTSRLRSLPLGQPRGQAANFTFVAPPGHEVCGLELGSKGSITGIEKRPIVAGRSSSIEAPQISRVVQGPEGRRQSAPRGTSDSKCMSPHGIVVSDSCRSSSRKPAWPDGPRADARTVQRSPLEFMPNATREGSCGSSSNNVGRGRATAVRHRTGTVGEASWGIEPLRTTGPGNATGSSFGQGPVSVGTASASEALPAAQTPIHTHCGSTASGKRRRSSAAVSCNGRRRSTGNLKEMAGPSAFGGTTAAASSATPPFMPSTFLAGCPKFDSLSSGAQAVVRGLYSARSAGSLDVGNRSSSSTSGTLHASQGVPLGTTTSMQHAAAHSRYGSHMGGHAGRSSCGNRTPCTRPVVVAAP